jgi:hypothetical protein
MIMQKLWFYPSLSQLILGSISNSLALLIFGPSGILFSRNNFRVLKVHRKLMLKIATLQQQDEVKEENNHRTPNEYLMTENQTTNRMNVVRKHRAHVGVLKFKKTPLSEKVSFSFIFHVPSHSCCVYFLFSLPSYFLVAIFYFWDFSFISAAAA